jgi:hypothetical protein
MHALAERLRSEQAQEPGAQATKKKDSSTGEQKN